MRPFYILFLVWFIGFELISSVSDFILQEKTFYTEMCLTGQSVRECDWKNLGFDKFVYSVDKTSQRVVVAANSYGIAKYELCSVLDNENWKCQDERTHVVELLVVNGKLQDFSSLVYKGSDATFEPEMLPSIREHNQIQYSNPNTPTKPAREQSGPIIWHIKKWLRDTSI